ncbi:hypothetical protein IP88_15600 [alpha proteobacterium AAP81b]|nr:hypothetical protein IP88_15600 [alpha proteobacterium AAP81b]
MIKLALPVALLLAAPALAAPLDDVAASLKATTSLSADFVQTDPTGAVENGKLLLARPGRVRFSYDKAPKLIVADGKKLTFVDYKVRQVSQWPVKTTPLGILLATAPDLASVAKVIEVTDRSLLIEAADPKRPEFGSLKIGFRKDASAPGGLALAGWTARDAQGGVSVVQLSNVRYNADLSKADFGFRDPRRSAVTRP